MKIPNLSGVKNAITRTVGMTGLRIRKASPEILIVIGVGGIIVAAVGACKATLKLEAAVDETSDMIEKIEDAHKTKSEEVYSEKDYQHDLRIAYVKGGVKIARLYAPSVLLGIGSIGCIVGSHGIMKKRNAALLAAYKALEASYASYRKSVRDAIGEEKEEDIRYGISSDETSTDENNHDIVVKVADQKDLSRVSQYARFFDESSKYFSNTPEYNLTFLKGRQDAFNDLLWSRGYVFLNEVYEELGLNPSQAGQLVGWLAPNHPNKSKNIGETDGFIDFGIHSLNTTPSRRFVNGYEPAILLDFNVDGVIYDLIESDERLNHKSEKVRR